MMKVLIDQTAHDLLAYEAIGGQLRQAVRSSEHPGLFEIELDQEVFDKLVSVSPPDVSRAVVVVTNRVLAGRNKQ